MNLGSPVVKPEPLRVRSRARMPTPAERLATLEEQMRGVREDVSQIVAMIGDQRTPGTVRGRLHKIENDIAALLLIRRGASQLLGRGWKIVAGVALLLTAAAPYVIFLASR